MGQYYTVYLEKPEGWRQITPVQYDNTNKLTESSFFGNNYVKAVCEYLAEPARVAWIGDYATVEDGMAYHANIADEELLPLLAGNAPLLDVLKDTKERRYLVNHTKGQYIDLVKYQEQYKELIPQYEDLITHPLPLLTACGNGQGGGDYWGMNQDAVGTWAFDTIQTTDSFPEGKEEIEILFVESWICRYLSLETGYSSPET